MTAVVVAGDKAIANWQSYDIEVDMLTPGDSFALSIGPVRRDVWDAVPRDQVVQIQLQAEQGTSPLITGIVDIRRRNGGRGSGLIEIEGRDKVGRFLVDDAADLQRFDQGTLLEAIKALASPWFADVVTSNARNRGLIVGARATRLVPKIEPVKLTTLGTIVANPLAALDGVTVLKGSAGKRQGPKKVDPGETRWEVISHFLELDRLLAWGSADGRELIIGRPNYAQPAQFRFTAPAPGSARQHLSNVVDFVYVESGADAHSQITVVGASSGDRAHYGRQVTEWQGAAKDGSGAFGVGGVFKWRKLRIVQDHDIKGGAQAAEKARRLLALEHGATVELELKVRGHTQALRPGAPPALYAPDTIAEWTDEEIGVRGRYLITRCQYRRARGEETTSLRLVPEGAELVS